MKRAAALAVLALALAPQAARAEPILSAGDAAELANTLADAREVHGICYGWHVRVDDDSGGPSGDDMGSDSGPNRGIDLPRCQHYAVLLASIRYTSDSSDAEDDAVISVDETLLGSITAKDLEDLGYGEKQLMGDDDDVALMNMVGSLPAIVAEQQGLEPVPFEPAEVPPGQQGDPTDSPGSDFVRENLILLALGGGLFAFGLVWFVLDLKGWLRPGLRAVGRALD